MLVSLRKRIKLHGERFEAGASARGFTYGKRNARFVLRWFFFLVPSWWRGFLSGLFK